MRAVKNMISIERSFIFYAGEKPYLNSRPSQQIAILLGSVLFFCFCARWSWASKRCRNNTNSWEWYRFSHEHVDVRAVAGRAYLSWSVSVLPFCWECLHFARQAIFVFAYFLLRGVSIFWFLIYFSQADACIKIVDFDWGVLHFLSRRNYIITAGHRNKLQFCLGVYHFFGFAQDDLE